VQHVLADGDGFRPARIPFEIGGDEGQAIARLGATLIQHGAHVALALQGAYCSAYLMSRGQELRMEWLPMKPDPPVTRIVLIAAPFNVVEY
jgi:hypothetical protein